MAGNGSNNSYSYCYECGNDSTRSCRWTAPSRGSGDWEMPVIEGPRIARSPKLLPWIIDEEKEWGVEQPPRKDKETDEKDASNDNMHSIDIDDIYPVVSLLTKPPLPNEFRIENCDDDDLEQWASQPLKEREALDGKLTLLLLKRGLSDFDYSSYGFTRLDLSQNSLWDISLFLILPSNFPSLKHLDLSYNKLQDISPLSVLINITHLDVSHNKLNDLLFIYPELHWFMDEPQSKTTDSESSSMGCDPSTSPLQWVNYSYNLVTKLGGERHWSHYPHLAYLNLSHNRISDTRDEGRLSSAQEQQSHSETFGVECGLAKLSILHTLDLSYNHIRRVEGLNGLKAHKLVLTGNSICCWEEAPSKQSHKQSPDAEVSTTEELFCRNEKRQSLGNEPKKGEEPPEADDAMIIRKIGREEEKTDELCCRNDKRQPQGDEQKKEEEILVAKDIMIIKKKRRKKEMEKVKKEKVKEMEVKKREEIESSKELKIIYRFDEKKEVKSTPLDTLYRKPEAQWTRGESSQEDNDLLKEWLQKDNIFGNWYDTDLKSIYDSVRVDYSEDSNNDSSMDGRIPPEPPMSKKHSHNSASHCEVLFERSMEISTEEESGETFERMSEERKDSEVRVLFEGLKPQGDDRRMDDYEEEAVKCEKREKNRLLYMKGEVPYNEKRLSTDELLETLFVRGSSRAALSRQTSYDRQQKYLEENGSISEISKVEDIRDDAVENAHAAPVGAEEGNVVDEGEESKSVRADESEGADEPESAEDSVEATDSGEETWQYVDKKVSSSASEVSLFKPGTEEAVKSEISSESEELNAGNEREGAEQSNTKEESIESQTNTDLQLGIRVGLRSLLNLYELHLEDNCICSLRMFRGMYCLSSLFIQNNHIADVGELMFLSDIYNLTILDMTGNPVVQCEVFEDLVHLLHPSIKSLNGIDCSTSAEAWRAKSIKMCWKNPFFRATRQYDDLLLETELLRTDNGEWLSPEIEYMSRVGAPYPVLLLVGPHGLWKESLCRNLCETLSEEVYVSPLCSTDEWLMKERNVFSCRYVSNEEFFTMLRSGKLASASQDGLTFLGLEKRHLNEAARKGRVLVSAVDLESALVLREIGFGGAPRLVLVLPGKTLEEKMLEQWRKRWGKTETEIQEWEKELRRGWRESNEEYLITHQQNPGLLEFGLIYEEDSDTLGKIRNLVLEMLDDRAKYSSFDSQEKVRSYQSMGVSESMMKLIDKRLEKELNPGIEIW